MFGEIKHANYLDDVKSKIRFYGTNGGLITCRSGYFLAESENSFSRHIFIMGDWVYITPINASFQYYREDDNGNLFLVYDLCDHINHPNCRVIDSNRPPVAVCYTPENGFQEFTTIRSSYSRQFNVIGDQPYFIQQASDSDKVVAIWGGMPSIEFHEIRATIDVCGTPVFIGRVDDDHWSGATLAVVRFPDQIIWTGKDINGPILTGDDVSADRSRGHAHTPDFLLSTPDLRIVFACEGVDGEQVIVDGEPMGTYEHVLGFTQGEAGLYAVVDSLEGERRQILI